MNRSIRLSLTDPCAEDWDKMLPKGCGRLCSACEKTVTDFSGMSNEDFIAFFQNTPALVCGRYTEEQLQLEIPVTDSMHSDLVNNMVPRTVKFKALKPVPIIHSVFRTDTQYRRSPRTAMLYPNAVKGKVTDNNGKAMADVLIQVKNTRTSIRTDHAGTFSITLTKGQDTLLCSTGACINAQIKVSDLSRPLHIMLPAEG